jgi:hypothetical protein
VEVDGLSDDDHSAGPSSKVRHLENTRIAEEI